jgi:hypothetical protein
MKLVNPEDAATLVPAPQRRQRASTTASRNLRDTAKGYPPGYYTVFLRARTRRQQELRLRVALAGLPALEIEDAVAPEQHRLAVDDEPALPVHARVDDPPKALV